MCLVLKHIPQNDFSLYFTLLILMDSISRYLHIRLFDRQILAQRKWSTSAIQYCACRHHTSESWVWRWWCKWIGTGPNLSVTAMSYAFVMIERAFFYKSVNVLVLNVISNLCGTTFMNWVHLVRSWNGYAVISFTCFFIRIFKIRFDKKLRIY